MKSGKPQSANGGRTSQALRVLVVDDEEPIREIVRIRLANDGHGVVVAENGQDALLLLKQETFDLVLTDISMPFLDGMQLRIEAERIGVATPFAYMTGSTVKEASLLGLPDAGCPVAFVLFKPFTREQLRLALASIISP